MLKHQKTALAHAQTEQLAAAQDYSEAKQALKYKSREFIRNPKNLLLPFTFGVLLASKGSTVKNASRLSRIGVSVGKVFIAAYPIYLKSRRKKKQTIQTYGSTSDRTSDA